MSTVREYDARVDTKKRVTLRGSEYRHYHVREYADGRIELFPQELLEISSRTLEMMDRSIENLDQASPVAPDTYRNQGHSGSARPVPDS